MFVWMGDDCSRANWGKNHNTEMASESFRKSKFDFMKCISERMLIWLKFFYESSMNFEI